MRARGLLVVAIVALGVAVAPRPARAHCDTLDGPVVLAGKRALESGELARAAIWVDAAREGELREAFTAAREVRRAGGKTRALADRFFLETLVRLHRATEGEPYVGLRPAGTGVTPAVTAADRAIATGTLAPASELVEHAVRESLEERFAPLARAGRVAPLEIEAGRAWVSAYVAFVHHVESLHAAATASHAH